MAYKNNIFEVITHIDKQDYQYFDDIKSDKEKYNELQPYILLRWLYSYSGRISDNLKKYLVLSSNLVNNNFFKLSNYKDLQLKMLCAIGNGKYVKHSWIPLSKIKKDKIKDSLKSYFNQLTDEEFDEKYNNLADDEITVILQNIGLSDERIKL